MTREEYRAHKKARGLTDDELSERLETGARMAALDTTVGRAYVREAHRRNANDHVARDVEPSLPDIAGTAAAIERFANVPLDIRLDYLAARSRALSLHGLVGYADAVAKARRLYDLVLERV